MSKSGQSTLEYVLLLTAIVLAILAVVSVANSPFRVSLNNYFSQMQTQFSHAVVRP